MHRWLDQLCNVIYSSTNPAGTELSPLAHRGCRARTLALVRALKYVQTLPMHSHARTHTHMALARRGRSEHWPSQPLVLKSYFSWSRVTDTVTTLMQRGAVIMISHPCPDPSAKSVKRKWGGSETAQLSINHLLTLTCVSPLLLLR